MDEEFGSLGASTIDEPSAADISFYEKLDLGEEDLELLLGEAPGLSWVDFKKDMADFYYRLRNRTAQLVCSDGEMRKSVGDSIKVGAEATWLSLLAAFGLNPGILAARALKPIALGVVLSGVEGLCKYS